jgi:hypothetical protein
MEQKSTSLWKTAMTYGLYIGIASIIYTVILYAMGQTFNQYLGYLSLIIVIGGIVLAQLNHRKLNGDVLTYGQGVGLAVTTMLFAGILTAIFTYLLYAVIDTDLYQQYLLFVEEKTTAKLTAKGTLSEEQISQAIELGKKFQTPVILAIGGIISSVIAGVIIGLITSIFTKKNPAEEVLE